MSILAARISYFLNLQGPCLSIDTACSSSFVAVAQACDSLISGGSDVALAGGVYVMVGPELHIKTSQAGMLSREGRCYTFDHRANGFVPGEGVGVVLLKRLADAQRDRTSFTPSFTDGASIRTARPTASPRPTLNRKHACSKRSTTNTGSIRSISG